VNKTTRQTKGEGEKRLEDERSWGHHVCENKLGLDDRSLGHVNLMAGFMTWVPKQNKISHVRTVCLLSPGCFIGVSQAFS